MCLGIPARVVRFEDDDHHIATVEVSGVRRKVNVDLVTPDGLEVGDWVLLHVGFAISKIDEEEARSTLDFLERLEEEYEQELDDLASSRIQ